MPVNILSAAELPLSPWPNKAGRKADIASGPGWMVAFAWLDQEARFSDYTGTDRTITLIDGDGFVLHFDNGADVAVAPLSPTPFDGGLGLTCHLPYGPCRVLNVMTERGRVGHHVRIGTDGGDRFGSGVLVALEDGAIINCNGQARALTRWDSVVAERLEDIGTTGLFASISIA